jgi:D-xylose reductase
MEIPLFGLGTWKIPKNVVAEVVYNAIKNIGIRHFDCACDYGNEVEVGEGIHKAINEGVVKREDLWITSKLWNTYHKAEHVELACKKSLSDMKLDYFDLYLVHFPIAMKFVPFEVRYPPEWIHDPSAAVPKIELEPHAPMHLTWGAMEALVRANLTKHIGVCNVGAQFIMDLLSYATIPPYTNQIELHPHLAQQVLVEFCQSRGVRCTAYSPLGSPSYVELGGDLNMGKGALDHPIVLAIAAAHNKTPAQVLLRWNIERGVGVIPKANQSHHLAENFAIFDFSLTKNEVIRHFCLHVFFLK